MSSGSSQVQQQKSAAFHRVQSVLEPLQPKMGAVAQQVEKGVMRIEIAWPLICR